MVLWFSGTGNSRHVARLLAEELGDELVSLNDRIRRGDVSPLQSESPYIVVCPIYAGRIPAVVDKHLRKTQFSGSRIFYFVVTYGTNFYSAAHYLMKLCRERRLGYAGMVTMRMPVNDVIRCDVTPPEKAAELVAAAGERTRKIAAAVRSQASLAGIRPRGTGMSDVFNPFFYPLCVTARPFRATDACTACGWCAEHCPLGNVTLQDGRPQWGGRCTQCMSCIGGCPAAAVEYGSKTVGKPRYYLREPEP